MKPKEKIIQLVSQIARIPAGSVALSTHLKNDLHLDSCDIMYFVILLEDLFQVNLSSEQIEKIHTVDDARQMVAV